MAASMKTTTRSERIATIAGCLFSLIGILEVALYASDYEFLNGLRGIVYLGMPLASLALAFVLIMKKRELPLIIALGFSAFFDLCHFAIIGDSRGIYELLNFVATVLILTFLTDTKKHIRILEGQWAIPISIYLAAWIPNIFVPWMGVAWYVINAFAFTLMALWIMHPFKQAQATDARKRQVSDTKPMPVEEIKRLKELFDDKIIDQEEFNVKKRELLDL